MAAKTTPFNSIGTIFQVSNAADAAFADASTGVKWDTIAQVADIAKIPAVKYEAVPKTLLTDTVEKVSAGRGKPSDWEVKCYYTDAAYAAAAAHVKLDRKFRVIFSDLTGFGWDGFVAEQPLQIPAGKHIEMSIKGEASGDTTKIAALSA